MENGGMISFSTAVRSNFVPTTIRGVVSGEQLDVS